jgi:oligosaccharide repeat unit polymerase
MTFINTDFPEDITQQVILIYLIFLAIIKISYDHFRTKNKILESKNNTVSKFVAEKSTDKFLFYIGKKIMIIFFCFVFYRSYLELKLLFGDRALLYILGSENIGTSVYLRFCSAIFQTGYLFILASYPTKKEFFKYSIVYILVIMPGMIIGNRAEFAVTLLFIIWYLYKMYNHKFNYLKLFISGIGFVVLLQIIAILRAGDKILTNIFELITTFLTYQSSSLDVIELYIEYKNELDGLNLNYPFILDPLIAGFTGLSGQNLEVLETRASLGHHLIYLLNPQYYLSGFSGGTSSIAELYQFGILGVSVGAIILGWFIAKVNYKLPRNRGYMMFSMLIFTTIVMSPRNSYFPNLYQIIKNLIFYFPILLTFKFFLKKPLVVKFFKTRTKFLTPKKLKIK